MLQYIYGGVTMYKYLIRFTFDDSTVIDYHYLDIEDLFFDLHYDLKCYFDSCICMSIVKVQYYEK